MTRWIGDTGIIGPANPAGGPPIPGPIPVTLTGGTNWLVVPFVAAAGTTKSVKGSAGYLRDFLITINAGGVLDAMIFDKAVAPVNGDVPIMSLRVQANQSVGYDFGDSGLIFALGLQLAVSTTQGILTLPGARAWFFARFI